jgi:protein SCO1/2
MTDSRINSIAYHKTAQVILWSVFSLMCLMLLWVMKENFLQPDLDKAVLFPHSMQQIPDFQLTDFNNETFNKQRLSGKWSFLFVGYTLCPDICPTTLKQMQWAHDLIKGQGQDGDVQFIFVSVDPERDDLARLKAYTQYFDKDFIGITGTLEQLEMVCDAIGASFYKVKHPDEPRFYYVVHSAEVFLFNPDGDLYAMYPPPHQAEFMVADFSVIKQHHNNPGFLHAGL